MRIKNFIKKNYKVVILIIIGFVLTGVAVYAEDTLKSSNVAYDNGTSNLTSTNMQDAIDELNEKATTKMEEAKKECPDGYDCLIKPETNCTVVSGTGNNSGDEIKCGSEYFYVVESSLKDITMITKYPIGETPPYGAPKQITDVTSYDVYREYVWGSNKTISISSDYFNEMFGYNTKNYISSAQGLSITQLEKLGCSIERLSGTNYNGSPGGAKGTCVGSGNSWLYSFGGYMIEITGPLPNYIFSDGSIGNHGTNLLLRPVVTIPNSFVTQS